MTGDWHARLQLDDRIYLNLKRPRFEETDKRHFDVFLHLPEGKTPVKVNIVTDFENKTLINIEIRCEGERQY